MQNTKLPATSTPAPAGDAASSAPAFQPGDIVRRIDPILNPSPYRVLRVHGDRVLAKPLTSGAAIEIPVTLLRRADG